MKTLFSRYCLRDWTPASRGQGSPAHGYLKGLPVVSMILALLALAPAFPAQAQVPGLLTYHGVIESNGNGVNGPGHFKFALVNDSVPSLITFWSNDGTLDGTEPINHVVVNVDHGAFSVVLGDTSLANMTALSTTIFTNAHVHLRLWFREGNNGPFTQLTPDQRMTAAGYAMMSAHVAEGAIGVAQLADGSITTAKLADGAVTSVKIATPSIHTPHLGNGSVTTPKLADGAVTTAKLAANAVGAAQVADNAITSADLADSVAFRELVLENSDGLNRIELSGSGDSGILRMNHGSIGRFLEVLGTTSGGLFKLFDKLGGELVGQTTVELGSSSLGGYARVYQDNGNAGVHLNGQNGELPGGTISVYRGNGLLGVAVQGQASTGGGSVEVRDSASDRRVLLQGLNGTIQLYDEGAAHTTLRARGDTGDLVALDRIGVATTVDASVYQASLGRDSNGGLVRTRDEADRTMALLGSGAGGGFLRLYRDDGTATVVLDADDANRGRVTTQVLQITGGSDLSEKFDIEPANGTPEPGMVVCIDPENPTRLALSREAYDRAVAGVISGAGGVRPGMLMSQPGSVADGRHPVALTGRVYCWVDASHGAIRPGDLLTTSPTPGHAMKVTEHGRANGAILGKAMTTLEQGTGLVLVLVSLQ